MSSNDRPTKIRKVEEADGEIHGGSVNNSTGATGRSVGGCPFLAANPSATLSVPQPQQTLSGNRRLPSASPFLVEQRVLQSVLDLASDAIITIDITGIVLSFNFAAEKLFQFSAGEVVGSNVSMLMPSPYCEEHDSYLRNYLGTGVPRVIGIGREVQGMRRDGSIFPMELSLSEVKNETTHLFTGIIRDITERYELQRRLVCERQEYQAVLDTAIDAIIIISTTGIIQSINDAGVRLFGYESDEVVGKNISTLMPASHAEAHDGYLRRYLATGERRIIGVGREVEGRRKNGTLFPLELAVAEVKNETVHMFTGFCRDISQRKAIERSMLEETRKLKGVFESCIDGIVIIDSTGIIQSMNESASRMFGYARDEIVGSNVSRLMPSPHAERHDGYLRKYLETGVKKIIGVGREVEGRDKSGRVFPIHLSVSEVDLGESGRLFAGVVRDINNTSRDIMLRW